MTVNLILLFRAISKNNWYVYKMMVTIKELPFAKDSWVTFRVQAQFAYLSHMIFKFWQKIFSFLSSVFRDNRFSKKN